MKKISLIIVTAITFTFTACNPKFKEPSVDKGNIDPSNYVALGGATTAGYADGALSYKAQQNSYAYILSEQLKLIGGGDFKIPYVSPGSIGIGNANSAPSILGDRTDCQGVVSLGPVKIALQGDLSVLANNVYAAQGPFNNLAVPNIKVTDVDNNLYSNPFYQRMASGPSSSILTDAVAKNPTFFTVMLGLNDVLDYALKGATADSLTPASGSVGIGFEASMNNIIDKLTTNGAKGVIANIPSIKSMAYFNTIPWNALALDADKATALTQFYSNLNPVVEFYEGNNGFIIEDNSQPLGYRQAVEGEMVLLNVPLDSVKCFKWGSLVVMPDKYFLTQNEIQTIENRISQFNLILKNIADARGLAFVDVNAFYSKVKTGYYYNGVSVNAAFVSGGFYSLDGLNLTPRGSALLANEFIKAINQTYQSTIPQCEATKFPGVVFP